MPSMTWIRFGCRFVHRDISATDVGSRGHGRKLFALPQTAVTTLIVARYERQTSTCKLTLCTSPNPPLLQHLTFYLDPQPGTGWHMSYAVLDPNRVHQ